MRKARLDLKLTYRCLGKCLYCQNRKKLWKARGGQDISISLIEQCKKLLTQKCRHPFQEIHFTGGEPTLHPNFIEIVEKLYETGLPLSATSAGWATQDGSWGKLLKRVPFHKTYISLDHANQNANDKIRGPGAWERATNAIREAVIVRDLIGQPEITVVSVVHRKNIDSLDLLASVLQKLGVDRWMPAHLENVNNKSELTPTTDDWARLQDNRRRAIVLDQALGTAFHPEVVPERLITHGEWPDSYTLPTCTTLGRLAIIHPNGSIYACYGSEYKEVSQIGTTDAIDQMDFNDLLLNAAKNPPSICRFCPEPIQRSQTLRQVYA